VTIVRDPKASPNDLTVSQSRITPSTTGSQREEQGGGITNTAGKFMGNSRVSRNGV